MYKRNLIKLLIAVIAIAGMSSCAKEEVLQPIPAGDEGATVVFIRAVDKDSSFVESEQILLR